MDPIQEGVEEIEKHIPNPPEIYPTVGELEDLPWKKKHFVLKELPNHAKLSFAGNVNYSFLFRIHKKSVNSSLIPEIRRELNVYGPDAKTIAIFSERHQENGGTGGDKEFFRIKWCRATKTDLEVLVPCIMQELLTEPNDEG